MNYEQQIIQELAPRIKAAGYRVFIAESGRHGFFTDADGSRVVSFQYDLGGVTFSGNYTTNDPCKTGTGWCIADSNTKDYDDMFNAYPPQWATSGATWGYTTLEKHLAVYQWSSGYAEV